MEIKLEVLASTSIKQRKPWPRIIWLGQEKEAVFLLDDKNINEINLLSGKTKKKIPQLHPLLKNVVVLTVSRNGAWLAGLLKTGELFLWNKDEDDLKIVPAVEESKKAVLAEQEYSLRLYLYVSDDGEKLLLTTSVCVFLWESTECKYSSSKHSIMGQWSQIIPETSVALPSVEEKETAVSAEFIKNEVLGDCCLCCFAFYSEELLMLSFLEIRWQESSFKSVSSSPCQIHWAQQTCSLPSLVPCCESVKSRGALLTAFSPDGLVLAVAVNQKDPQATQILFMNTMNFITVSGSIKGCGSKNRKIPSKFIRSYWIANMSWTPDSLFLACMLKRGSLIIMTCLGELLTLVTFGCSVEFGPAEFIPLHPLITYRSAYALLQDSNHSHNSSASEGDHMRQRFSVTSHPRLPYLIASDGYNVTVLRFCDRFSPSAFLRSLLLDSTQRLEKLRQSLIASKPKGKRLLLQSLSSLRVSLLQHHENQSSALSAIPKFLQDGEGTEQNGNIIGFQDHAEESDEDKQFQSHSFVFGSQKTDISLSEEGRLEFASMFDTIRAVDGTREEDNVSLELNSIQKNLLAAWRVGISRSVQERDTLLSCTIHCMMHFFSILRSAEVNLANSNNSVKDNPWMPCVLNCFQQFLTLLSWDGNHRQTLGHLIKLTLHTLKLMLAEQCGQLFPSHLLGGFSLLKMVTHYLNGKNLPQYAILPAFLEVNSNVELDCLVTPVFQAMDWSSHQNYCVLNSVLNHTPPTVNPGENPEKRLTVMWQLLYQHVLRYRVQLNRKMLNSNKLLSEVQIVHREPIIEALTSHIQAILQSSGEKLDKRLKLNSVTGEEQFLIGSYQESVEIWEKALQDTKGKGKRTPFLQTRYYLAILYCHLYYYSLREAQGLCDHLVRELLKRTNISVNESDDISDAELVIRNVHTEAILAVVQSLARFMAAYFTDGPLFVLPPHNVDVLPPLHIRPDRCPRVVPLQHSRIASAIRDHSLSCVWTVEYALDLFLVSGLIPEAVWLAHKLGNWKMSVSIGVAFNHYCQSNNDFSRSQKVELCLPQYLTPTQIFQEKLQSFMGQPASVETTNEGKSKYRQFTDPIEEEDANMLFKSVEEILKAAVMADADILSEIFQLLMDCAKDLSRKFYSLVPEALYLPAPPLYCPQPAFLLSEEEYTDLPLRIERDCRQKVSGVVQRILLLFRAAHCSFPAAQWYIVQLKQARKIMQKIRKKGALPLLNGLPENLLNYSKSHMVFFRPTSSGDSGFDDISCRIIECFRELCALCWMLHVRERLSYSCRQYQTAREKSENWKESGTPEFDACVVEHCLNALEWACRMLPFARFMNVEELVQDIILSLTGELPPIQKVAEILVKAFPNSEDVRVPLRDKYNALLQRLRHCAVKGPNSEKSMSTVIESAHKVNLKTLKRVIRNIGPNQRSIWEPPEEEMQDFGTCCYDGLSLGTSLSRSTVSDMGNPQVYSDAETGDSVSEALLMEEARKSIPSQMQEDYRELNNCAVDVTGYKNTTEKLNSFSGKENNIKRKTDKEFSNQCVLPVVGVWEFERDDDEYVKFLDLFLTYVLERDHMNHRDSAVPFLKSFSALLREHELNSLLFDVHTTLKRRQNRTKGQNVFRAGSSYTLILKPSHSETASLCDETKKEFKKGTSPVSVQQPIEPPCHGSVTRLTAKRGLFGVSSQSVYRADSSKGITLTPVLTQCLSDHASVIQTPPVHKYIYRAIQVTDDIQREESAPEIKNKFNNLARLLEWMIRWSDRQLVYDHISTEPLQEHRLMMHIKTSASAILASFWLLEQRQHIQSQDQYVHLWNPRKQCASIHSSGIPSKLEKESSVDTGYSPSVETPVVVQDGNAYCEPYESASRTLHEKLSEKKEVNFEDLSVTHGTQFGGRDFDEDLIEVGESIPDEVDVTSENEEFSEEPFAASRSPTMSVSIKSVQHKKLSSSSEPCPQEEPLMERLEEEGGMTNLNGTPCEAILSDIPCSFDPEMKVETSSIEISVADDQQSFTVVSSVHSSKPVGSKKEVVDGRDQPSFTAVSGVQPSNLTGSKKEEVASRDPVPQPLNISDAVRQMLQDEMFKLVQLQQINFMSLMQVVGSSFANLPDVSHHLQQSQPSHLGRSQASNAAGTYTDRCPLNHSADGPSKSQMPALENPSDSNRKRSSREEESLPDQNDSNSMQKLPHIGDASGLPESQSFGTKPIPPFQELLHQVSARPLPLLSASLNAKTTPRLIPLAKPLNNAHGFPLLKLKQGSQFRSLNICPIKLPKAFGGPFPQPREAWGPFPVVENSQDSQTPVHKNESTACLNLNSNPEAVRPPQEQGGEWPKEMNEGPSRHIYLSEYEEKENVTLSQHLHTHLRAEKPLVDDEIPLHKRYENFAPIPLLCLKPCSQPKHPLPVKLTAKEMDSRNPFWHKGMPLLYSSLPPLTKFQTPKLIPLQNLVEFEQSHQIVQAPFIGHKDHPERIQLLKANIKPFEAREDRHNKKRQRRRVKKQIKEKEEGKKATVTFRQDDSFVLPGTVEKTKDNQVESNYDLNDGDHLLDPEAVVSSAELHYLASVRKRPPDIQDASTNTDPVLKSHQDMQTVSEDIVSEPVKNQSIISVPASDSLPSCVPETLPPALYLNLRFPTEAAEMPLPSSVSNTTSDLIGRKYINVIDIENDDLLKNLPEIPESAVKHIPQKTEKPEVLTSAKLHHMAASVTNAVPPEEFENKGHTLQAEPSQGLLESSEAEIAGDHLTLHLLQEDFSTNPSTGQLAKQISRQKFSAKLQEMDKQLVALQKMAERMEQEFRNTKVLVKAPLNENAIMMADPGEYEVSLYAPGVKVSKEERYSTRVIVEDSPEEEDDMKPESSQNKGTILQSPSVSRSASAGDLPSVKKSLSDICSRLEEVNESFSEDPLQITGLSGVSDIISDLLTGGGVSAAELGLTKTQAKKMSRRSSVMSGHSHRTEEEKKELQTWMKRKQKKRLDEYLQKLAEQREKEHNPFQLRNNLRLGYTSREIKLQQKKKDEKDKVLFSEHHNHRISRALTLMQELLSDTVQLPSSELGSLSKTRLPQDFKRPRVSSAGRSYQSARNSTVSKVGLGQTRSFSSLPSDTTWRKASVQRQLQSTNRATQANEESEEEMSGWSIPDEIQQILYGTSNSHLEELLPPEESFSVASINNLDSVSESTSSILSKLDWNAVEAMVANLEEK